MVIGFDQRGWHPALHNREFISTTSFISLSGGSLRPEATFLKDNDPLTGSDWLITAASYQLPINETDQEPPNERFSATNLKYLINQLHKKMKLHSIHHLRYCGMNNKFNVNVIRF
jgi:hypothetical protein